MNCYDDPAIVSAGRGIRGAGEDCLSPQGEFRGLQSGCPGRRGLQLRTQQQP